MELEDKPGIIITVDDKVIRTTKVKKYITKNKIDYKEFKYLENVSNDFKEVERSLKELENSYLGLGPIKDKPIQNIIIDNSHYYCFWHKKCKGWFDSKFEDMRDWPWHDTDEFTYIGEQLENETLEQTHKRLFKLTIGK